MTTFIVRAVTRTADPAAARTYWLAEIAGNVHLTTAAEGAREYMTRTAAHRTAALHAAHSRAVRSVGGTAPLMAYIVEEVTE